MTTTRKIILVVLLILNSMVLCGQIWPEGAPPFAHTVNIIALCGNIFFFISLFRKQNT